VTFFKKLRNYLVSLVTIDLILIGLSFLVGRFTDIIIYPEDAIILVLAFSAISIITYVIFIKGQSKEPQSQTFHTLFSVGLKFLLELGLVLIWFIAAKKNALHDVIMFFVLYLALTLFSVFYILKVLKDKTL
jgi:hypothetical protein